MEVEQSVSLAPVAESARAGRQFVRLYLDQPVPPPVAEVAVLLTSELIANAVLHAGPHAAEAQIVLRVTSTARRIRIDVEDHSTAAPVLGDGSIDKPSGRGMLLVDRLASVWGVEPGPHGKTVWFAIDL